MGIEDVVVLHHQGAKDDLLEDLGDIFYLLRLLHVIVPVDVGINLHPEEGKTEMIERFIIKAHCHTIDLLDGKGKELDILKHPRDIFVYREGDPSPFEHLLEIHLLVNHLYELFHDGINPLPGRAVLGPDYKRPPFVTGLPHLWVKGDGAEEWNLEHRCDPFSPT